MLAWLGLAQPRFRLRAKKKKINTGGDIETNFWILCDLNVGVDTDIDVWPGVLGHYGDVNMNSSELRLLRLCFEFDLTITNTHFQRKNIDKHM